MDKNNKKELMKTYKERTVIGGVYAIVNTVNGKRLMGKTTDIQGSRNRFEFSQKMNSAVSPRLKDDWTLHGGKAFRFEEIELLEKKPEQSDRDFSNDIDELFEITAQGAQPDRYI